MTFRERSFPLLSVGLLLSWVAQALGRGLLKGSEVTYVTTAVELINATERGDPYIEILSHLDFQGIEFKLNGGDVKLNTTVPVGQNTRSIRGNCQDSFPSLADVPSIASGPDLWPQKPGQCLLSGFGGWGIMLSSPKGFPVWLDNLYLRVAEDIPESGEYVPVLLGMDKHFTDASIRDDVISGWMTNITLQLNSFGETAAAGLSGKAYIEDGLFLSVRGFGIPLYVGEEGATCWLKNCDFADISIPNAAPVILGGEGTSVKQGLVLENVTWSDVKGHGDVVAFNGSEIYSDASTRIFRFNSTGQNEFGGNGDWEIAKDISQAEASSLQFISWPDAQDLVQEVEAARQGSPPPLPPGADDDCDGGVGVSDSIGNSCGDVSEESSGLSTVAVVAIVACAVAAVALAVLAAVCYFRRRKSKQQKAKVEYQQTPFTDAAAPTAVGAKPPVLEAFPSAAKSPEAHHLQVPQAVGPQEVTNSSVPSLAAASLHGRTITDVSFVSSVPAASGSRSLQATPSLVGTSSMNDASSMHGHKLSAQDVSMISSVHSSQAHGSVHHSAAQPSPPPQQAQMASMNSMEPVDRQVWQALKYMRGSNQVIAGRYTLPGPPVQQPGSFGIVQLANIMGVKDAVALKFFTDAAGFANEQRAYSMPAITQALDAPTFMNNADRAAVMPSGLPFPPFTVAEKGQSLEVWLRSFSADAITTMQILGQVMKSVTALHGTGLAHRNIKPSNIIQRPKQHDWVLSDFAASCPFGAVAPLPRSAASLAYTAPEVLVSVGSRNPPAALASAEADMWAVGMLAFELLTGERVFPEGTPTEAIHAALRGLVPLPWEDGAENCAQRRETLRSLQRLVLPCLSRDPAQRPSAKAAINSFYSMFDDMKTRGTFEAGETPQ